MEFFDEVTYFLLHLYDGLPWWSIPIFLIALVMILGSVLSTVVLSVQAVRMRRRDARDARRARRARHAETTDTGAILTESDFLWVFLVPALNEEVTIADSVGRLREVDVSHKIVLVINDGSDDRTGEVLTGLSGPDLTVLERRPPEARQGKSEALNDAWRYLHREVLTQDRTAHWTTDRVIISVVDADGRLDREAGRVAQFFSDARVGGVQSLVRIYNRSSMLTWAQDVEFGVFGMVLQRGRTAWGSANMGGNGQFNRLAALDSVVVEDAQGRRGPWKAGRLTEDQDIGLRLSFAGWRGAQSDRVSINQQGLNSLRALYRQRTRWAQGGWQVLDQLGNALRNRHLGFVGRVDQVWYLLTPIVQAWVGLSVVLSAIFLVTGMARPQWTITIIVLLYLFSAVPGLSGVLLARRSTGFVGFLRDLALAHLYLIYSWLIYPVVYRAGFRELTGRKSWAKTKREAISRPAEPATAMPSHE